MGWNSSTNGDCEKEYVERARLVGEDIAEDNTISVKVGGNKYAFLDPTVDGREYKLCYQFGDEPYKLFSAVKMSVKRLDELEALRGLTEFAVRNEPKPFRVDGFGVADGDSVKFVVNSRNDHDDCELAQSLTEAGIRGDRAGGKTFTTIFLEQSLVGEPFKLCYRFANEPWVLYAAFQVLVMDLGSTSTSLALSSVPVDIAFYSQHISGTTPAGIIGLPGVLDEAKWILSSDSDCESSEPAAGSSVKKVIRDPILEQGKALFRFSQIVDESLRVTLCYKFVLEPFKKFETLQMSIIPPKIDSANTGVAVQDVEKMFIFTGTLGITKIDFVKYVNEEDGCESVARGGTGEVQTQIIPGLITSKSAKLRFNDTVPPGETWVLCYKFGAGNFLPFPDIRVDIRRLDNVTRLPQEVGSATSSSSTIVAGEVVTFSVRGRGIADGDTLNFVLKDEEGSCREGGNIIASGVVVDRKARIIFDGTPGQLQVCYGFVNESLTLYPDIDVKVEQTLSEKQIDVRRGQQVLITLVLDLDYASFFPATDSSEVTQEKKNAFGAAVLAELAAALEISRERMILASIKEGSIILQFIVLPPLAGESDLLADQVAIILEQQIEILQQSILADGNITRSIDVERSLPLRQILSEAPVDEEEVRVDDFAVQLISPKSSGVFEFSQDSVSVSEKSSSGMASLFILRTQGTAGRVLLKVKMEENTATEGKDYVVLEDKDVEFADGERSLELRIRIIDDDVFEEHYEVFTVSIEISDKNAEETLSSSAVGDIREARVKIFDFGEGPVQAQSDFRQGGQAAFVDGWHVDGNGAASRWASDESGIFAMDEKYSMTFFANEGSHGEAGSMGKTEDCDEDLGSNAGLELGRDAYLHTQDILRDLPQQQLTVAIWLRSTETQFGGVIAGIVGTLSDSEQGAPQYEFALADPRLLVALVQGSYDMDTSIRDYDGLYNKPQEGRRHFQEVSLNDGSWHHLAATWRSTSGQLRIFVDGALASEANMVERGGTNMSTSGFFIVGRGTSASVQSAALFSLALEEKHVRSTMMWPLEIERPSILGELYVFWRLARSSSSSSSSNTLQMVIAPNAAGLIREENGAASGGGSDHSDFSNASHAILSGTKVHESAVYSPVLDAPCTEDSVWYFVSPAQYAALEYDGRIQFRLRSPSFSGQARSTTALLKLVDAEGGAILYSSKDFPGAPGNAWESYSIVLREDFGWIDAESRQLLGPREMQKALKNTTQIFIRGDGFTCGGPNRGSGEESTYLDGVTVIRRSSSSFSSSSSSSSSSSTSSSSEKY